MSRRKMRGLYNNVHVACPVCGARSQIYTSRPVTRSTRELYFRCSNEACDASFRSLLSHVNLIIDSRLPDGHPDRLPPDADMPKLITKGPRSSPNLRQLELPALDLSG